VSPAIPGNPGITLSFIRANQFELNMNNQYGPLISTKPITVVIVMVTALLAVSGCTANRFGISDQERPGNTAQSSIHRNAIMEYRIGPADVLSISVWNHREMNQTVTVRPDGNISFPLTGDIQVVGLTPLELQDVMEKALGKYMEIIPGEVSVVVDEVHSYKVSVLGEVHLPGQFEFQSQATVLDALAEAGGLTEFASSSNIQILRTNNGQLEKRRFDYKKLIKTESSAERILIFPGDVILVP
jgi:polysaccharide export outer membrane protein